MWPARQILERPFGVTVFGSAVRRVEPDLAVATLGVGRVAREPGDAFSATRDAVRAVREALINAGIDTKNLEVSRIALEDAYDGFAPNRKFIGYKASVNFKVRIENLLVVEKALVEAVRAGANTVGGVTYMTSKLKDVREGVRREAIAAAKRKADVYCEAAGITLGAVIHIEDVNPDQLVARGGHAAMAPTSPEEDEDSGAIQSGSIVVSGAVVVGYALIAK